MEPQDRSDVTIGATYVAQEGQTTLLAQLIEAEDVSNVTFGASYGSPRGQAYRLTQLIEAEEGQT